MTWMRQEERALPMFKSFTEIQTDIAERLGAAVKNRNLPMHSPVVATADADARVMVLRAFDAGAWTLRFHTDLRSPKCGVIGTGAPVGVLFYDKPEKVQIRVHGVGRIEHDTPLADAAWEESTNFAKRCYLGDGPGVASVDATSGLPEWAKGIQPTDEQVAPARDNFAILLIELHELDWFHLANSGHIRAQFSREIESWEGRWASP